MNQTWGICKNCQKKRPIVNKKYYLCEFCNKERLGTPIKRNRISHVSKKESYNLRAKNEVYKQMEEESVFDQACSGCGQQAHLSRAHIISQSNKKFQADRSNIVYDCILRTNPDKFGSEGCHQRWEQNNWEKLLTLKNLNYRLQYLKDNDPMRYNKLMILKEQYEQDRD